MLYKIILRDTAAFNYYFRPTILPTQKLKSSFLVIFKTDFSQLKFIGRKFKNSGNLTFVFISNFLLEPERITRFNTAKNEISRKSS